jgi:Ser/Thr protein kinase RdoA (MazF antagonist)
MQSPLEREDLSDDPMVFNILKTLIDRGQTEFIPYRAYQAPYVYRIELDNTKRMDHLDLSTVSVMAILPLIRREMNWLYSELWSKSAIHGDLTNNNIIYQDGVFYFIDWEMANIVQNNICGLWYIFADIIDFLNVFYVKLPAMFESVYKISPKEFTLWYNIIKTQENLMKDNENPHQCNQAFMSNMDNLVNFVAFVKKISGLDLVNVINTLMAQAGLIKASGGKKRKATLRRKIKNFKKKHTL